MHRCKSLRFIRRTSHLKSCQSVDSHGKQDGYGKYGTPDHSTSNLSPRLRPSKIPKEMPDLQYHQYHRYKNHSGFDRIADHPPETDHSPNQIPILLRFVYVKPDTKDRKQDTIGVGVGNADPGRKSHQNHINIPCNQSDPKNPARFTKRHPIIISGK